ncbi:MAG: hypothetical protein WDZ40_02150 [Candidatus Spechtbacterales bacterium]
MTNTRSTVFFVSIVVSLVFAWFFVWPSLQGIDAAKKAIELEREDVAFLEETRAEVHRAASFFSSLGPNERELIELAAPSFKDEINAVVVLDRIARENGLSVEDIRTGNSPVAEGEILRKISVTVIAEGSYSSVKAFILRAENSLRIFDVERVIINSNDEEAENPGLLSVEILGNVYFTETGN